MAESDKVKRVQSNYDFALLLIVVAVAAFGVIMVYSASTYNSEYYYNDPTFYLRRQALFAVIGTVVMVAVSLFNYNIYQFWVLKRIPILTVVYYLICLALLIFTYIWGKSAGGSSRWTVILGNSIQPSELSKLSIILTTSYIMTKYRRVFVEKYGNKGELFCCAVVAVVNSPMIALVAYKNFSSGVIMAFIMLAICFVAIKRKLIFIVSVTFLAVIGGVLFVCFTPYRIERIMDWLNHGYLESGSQLQQGIYAIASGGIFGRGLGEGVLKKGFIQEVHTDMIFTVVCEELGLVGGIILIVIFVVIIMRLLSIALYAPNLYGALIVTGVLAQVSIQVLLNIGVVTRAFPATGVTLPFISYGGSSLLVLFCEIGLALSVSKFTYKE